MIMYASAWQALILGIDWRFGMVEKFQSKFLKNNKYQFDHCNYEHFSKTLGNSYSVLKSLWNLDNGNRQSYPDFNLLLTLAELGFRQSEPSLLLKTLFPEYLCWGLGLEFVSEIKYIVRLLWQFSIFVLEQEFEIHFHCKD